MSIQDSSLKFRQPLFLILLIISIVSFDTVTKRDDRSRILIDNTSASASSSIHPVVSPHPVKLGACNNSLLAVHLTGGIGNHLFGAAFGYAHSMRKSGSIKDLLLIPDEQNIRKQQVSPIFTSLLSTFTISNSSSLEVKLAEHKLSGNRVESY